MTTSQTVSPIGSPLNEMLVALILPWAKEHHPEKYAQTIQMVKHQPTFRKYLTRLIEIRWETDPTFRSEAPCWALEETSIVARLRDRKTGEIFEVKGRNATGGRVWSFQEMMLDRESFDVLRAWKREFDLELVPT